MLTGSDDASAAIQERAASLIAAIRSLLLFSDPTLCFYAIPAKQLRGFAGKPLFRHAP